MSDSVQPHRQQPTRLPRPWDSPGKNTGVGCHFPLQCMKVNVKVKSLNHVRLLATPWTAAHQAPPSMEFSGQEYWSGVPLLSLCFKLCETNSTCKISCKMQGTSEPSIGFFLYNQWIKTVGHLNQIAIPARAVKFVFTQIVPPISTKVLNFYM